MLFIAFLGGASALEAGVLFGVTGDNQLSSFDTSNPSVFTSQTPISGLVLSDGVTTDPFGLIENLAYDYANARLVGIDGNANIYVIGGNGMATLLNTTFSPTGFSAGLAYDVFTDNLIYAADDAMVYTIDSAGTASSGSPLVYGAGDPNQGSSPAIFGVGIDPIIGSAFFVDSNTDTLSRSIDPNFAELLTVGDLGIDVSSFGGMVLDDEGNLFGVFSTDAQNSSLYSINQTTGAATLVGALPSGITAVAVPEPSTGLLALFSVLPLFRRRRS